MANRAPWGVTMSQGSTSGRIRAAALVFVSLFLFGHVVLADSAEDWARMRRMTPKAYVCYRVVRPPRIDGRVDDAIWQRARWTDDFVDIEGDRKPKPRFRTRAKMIWDEEYFYIAAEMEEPHVWATLKKHDSVIYRDNDFEVFIDPNGDNHEYYEFEMNAFNTGWDLFLPRPYKDGGRADNSWEIPGLQTAVYVQGTLNDPADNDRGWSVEIGIPWQAFREFARRPSPPDDGDQWRVNFSRVEWRHRVDGNRYQKIPDTREDNWVWSPQGIIDMHRPECWGFVQFSTSQIGETRFQADPALAVRNLLMGVYHHQKSFFRQHNRWARHLSELGIGDTILSDVKRRPTLTASDDGFEATLELRPAGQQPQRWHVRQDSRIWNSFGKDPTGPSPHD